MKDLTELKKEHEELGEEIKRLEQAEQGLNWKPDVGEVFYTIESEGRVSKWEEGSWGVAQDDAPYGNIYQTEEQAQQILDNRKTLVKLREYGFKPDWGDGDSKFYFKNGYIAGVNIKADVVINRDCPVYFKTEEKARQALEAVGQEAVKQLLEVGLV